LQKEKIESLKKYLFQIQECLDLVSKENESLKKEISDITKRFSIDSETLEHILYIQIPYYNKSCLGLEKESVLHHEFAKYKDRKKQKPSKFAYRNHVQK